MNLGQGCLRFGHRPFDPYSARWQYMLDELREMNEKPHKLPKALSSLDSEERVMIRRRLDAADNSSHREYSDLIFELSHFHLSKLYPECSRDGIIQSACVSSGATWASNWLSDMGGREEQDIITLYKKLSPEEQDSLKTFLGSQSLYHHRIADAAEIIKRHSPQERPKSPDELCPVNWRDFRLNEAHRWTPLFHATSWTGCR